MQNTEKCREFESNPLAEGLFHTFNTTQTGVLRGDCDPYKSVLVEVLKSVYICSAKSSTVQYYSSASEKRHSSPCWQGDCCSLPCWERWSSYRFSHGFFFVTQKHEPLFLPKLFAAGFSSAYWGRFVCRNTFLRSPLGVEKGTSPEGHPAPNHLAARQLLSSLGVVWRVFLCSFVLFTHFCNFKGVFSEGKLLCRTHPKGIVFQQGNSGPSSGLLQFWGQCFHLPLRAMLQRVTLNVQSPGRETQLPLTHAVSLRQRRGAFTQRGSGTAPPF